MKTQLLRCPEGIAGSLVIPFSVTTIAVNSFTGCRGVTEVTIPNTVTNINNSAFSGSGLTSVFLPASVTSLHPTAFVGCGELELFTVDAANPNYSSEDGALYNKAKSRLITCPGGFAGIFTIPNGVTHVGDQAFQSCTGLTGVNFPASLTAMEWASFANCTGLTKIMLPPALTRIGNGAFRRCTGLTSVTIPASVTSIQDEAFSGNPNLKSAIFLGNAPFMGDNTIGFGLSSVFASLINFEPLPQGFKVYYFNGATGFTSPTWVGYPTVNMGGASAAKAWLVSHGFAYDANLRADSDGDGVDLLTAYALKLDPRLNLAGSLPKPVVEGSAVKLTFYAGNADVGYGVQSSDDLVNWSPDGISLSAPDADGMRTATASAGRGQRYVRLALSR